MKKFSKWFGTITCALVVVLSGVLMTACSAKPYDVKGVTFNAKADCSIVWGENATQTDKEYYYVNWGWGGWANGYYALEALIPDDPDDDGYIGSFHEYESLMVNFKKPANFDADPDDDTDTDPVYNLKENSSLVYDHASRTLSITVQSGVKVTCKSERGVQLSVMSAGSNVYEIDARGLSGVYDVILSKGSSQEVVQIILGE